METPPVRIGTPPGALDAATPEFQRSLTRAICEASPDGILVVNAQGLVVSHNPQFAHLWQLPPASVPAIGASDAPLLVAMQERVKDQPAFLARMRALSANPQLDEHGDIELKDGRTLECHASVLGGDTDRGLGRVWFFRDITSQKQTAAALLEMTRYDALTGAANRRYFFERAQQEFARSRRRQTLLSIVSFDIDGFKQINERYGHAAGDEVLKSLCNHSQGLLREAELFARVGGGEFSILMPDTSLHGATHLAERLLRATTQSRLRYNGQEIGLSISIGVTTLKSSDQSIEDCLRRSDHAMYRAKQNGRNRIEAVT